MKDKTRLRALAGRYAELLHSPSAAQKKKDWTALHDLHPRRPMFLLETALMPDFVKEEDLCCEDGFLRRTERELLHAVRHAELIGDDYVLQDYFPVPWKIGCGDYGVGLQYEVNPNTHAIVANHPLRDPQEVKRLKPRAFWVDRASTLAEKEELAQIFGDLLPVREAGPLTHVPGLTRRLFDLIGPENMYFWPYDEPESFHAVMRYLTDDSLAFYEFLCREGLLSANNGAQMAGSGSYGFTQDLPSQGVRSMGQVWGWVESQETSTVSPAMFEEFVLPYLAEISRKFGLVYYGCCEQLHDRWERIERKIGNIRSVSVSPWSDVGKMHEFLGKRYVFSKKLTPQYLSVDEPDFRLLREEAVGALRVRKDAGIELIYRDIYQFKNAEKFQKWAQMMRAETGA